MPSLHNTQLFLFLFPHLLSLPPCSLSALRLTEWGVFRFCTLPEQPQAKIWPQLCSTLCPNRHIKLSCLSAVHLITLVLLSRVCTSVQYRELKHKMRVISIAYGEHLKIYSWSPKEEIISHEYTKHLPSSPETKTHKPEQRLPLNHDWNRYPCLQVEEKAETKRAFKHCQFLNFYP